MCGSREAGVFPALRPALRWVVWGPRRFPAHLPADALTLSAPIIIGPALLGAAIPGDWIRLKRLRPAAGTFSQSVSVATGGLAGAYSGAPRTFSPLPYYGA